MASRGSAPLAAAYGWTTACIGLLCIEVVATRSQTSCVCACSASCGRDGGLGTGVFSAFVAAIRPLSTPLSLPHCQHVLNVGRSTSVRASSSLILSIGDKAPYHSLTSKKANGRRKVVTSPGINNHPKRVAGDMLPSHAQVVVPISSLHGYIDLGG